MSDKPPAPGSEYELLTRRLLESIGAQTVVETIELTRLKKFRGQKTGTQLTIDIWWQFRIGNRMESLVFQCKDWASPIKQEHVYALRGVLDDLPGSPRAVMVTRTGYQRGARLVANAHGITILELREPTEADWDGRLKDIYITLVMARPHLQNFSLLLPEAHPESPDTVPPAFGALVEDVVLENEEGHPIIGLADIIKSHVPGGFDETQWKKVDHRLDEILYLKIPEEPSRLPIHGVSFEIRQTKTEELIAIRGDDLVKYILRDVLGGELVTFGHDETARPGQDVTWLRAAEEQADE
jgi:hypothetical protein